jgi:gamma-glutamyltranspeptidase / glutathione hydrolase
VNPLGHDSCDTIIADKQGNVVAGNHTISSLPWGDGLMTDGVILNSAYPTTADSTPGERAIDMVVPVLIFKDGKPWAAAGFFDGSLQAASFEVLLNLMDYGMNPNDAIYAPRFGWPTSFSPIKIPLDPRYPVAWVQDFAKKGIFFARPSDLTAYVDTGDAMVIRFDQASGLRYASPSEVLSSAVSKGE